MKPTSSFSLPNSSSPALPRHLCPAAHQRTSAMATFNNGGSSVQLSPPSQVSVLNFFFPGFNGITAATEQLLTGKLNSLANFLYIYGILLYLAKYISNFAWEWINGVTITASAAGIRACGGKCVGWSAVPEVPLCR